MAKRTPAAAEAVTVATKREVARRPGLRPSAIQRRYLALGAQQPGGKLPLFDGNGREIGRKTVESCIDKGWAKPWFANPLKPDWLVCKLTPAGYAVLGEAAPASG
ncbi:MAG: hypothetical protein ACTSP2_06690 [Alphaproteobacteria bacterium]